MMVAVMSDVHGNLPALEKFLECTNGKVDAYVCLGDVVNYGPWNDEALELIHALPNVVLLEGNHERLFLGTENIADEIPLVQEFYRHSIARFRRFDLIAGLARSHQLESFLCVHTIGNRRIYADTPIEPTADYFIGHTHHQFHVWRAGHQIVNCGSVGQNRRYIDVINYALLDTVSSAVTLCSAPYAFDRLLDALIRRGYPKACVDYYLNKPKKGSA